MYLEKIDIQGFKSFANKETIVFPKSKNKNKGITAIVGPNGAGKSNIVDAIRWVLGEQSLKLLRGKKSEDVIFHGSTEKSRLGMAEVTLYINNYDKTIPLDYSEIMLTRKIYRSGESEYLINKGKAKLSEIIMLLAKANFGQKSFSIIGQGMIDNILQAGDKERKDFFDEAVGVKQYQIKRHQTINNLKRVKLNLVQLNIVLAELEPRVFLLSRQAKKLEKREIIKEKLSNLQIAYYSKLYFYLNDKIREIDNELFQKNKINKTLGENFLLLQKKLAIFANEDNRNEIFNKLKEAFDIFNNKKNNLLKESVFLKSEINIEYKKEGQLNLAWITQNKDDLKENINKIKNNLELLKQEEQITIKKLNLLKNNLIELNKKLKNLNEQINIFTRSNLENKNDKNWQIFIKKIIAEQEKLITKIELAEKKEDFLQLKDRAQKIKKLLEQLKNKGVFEQEEKNTKNNLYLVELTEKQNNLIVEKNNFFREINSWELKLSITKEKIKMTKIQLAEKEKELDKVKSELKVNNFTNQTDKTKEYQKKIKEIEKEIEKIDSELKSIKIKLANFNQNEQAKKDKVFALQKKIQEEQLRINKNKDKINNFLVEKTRYETKKEDLTAEINEEIESTHKLNRDQRENNVNLADIYKLKKQLALIGGIDPEIINEYKESQKRYQFLTEQVLDLHQTIEKLNKIIKELDKIIKQQFDEIFEKINTKFNAYFKILFNGGEAKLSKYFKKIKESEEELNQEEEKKTNRDEELEIEIKAAPYGKKLKDIHILSGGEKSLTSIALICAIISVNPSPFIILDEVDAALDEANSIKFSKIIQNLAHKTQFITITHNRATMEGANILYGITVQEKGISKVLSITLEEAKIKAAR